MMSGKAVRVITLQFSFVLLVEKILYYIFDIHGEVNFFLQIREVNACTWQWHENAKKNKKIF